MEWKGGKRSGSVEDRRGTVGDQGNRMLRKIDKSGLNLNDRQTADLARQSVSPAVQTVHIVKEMNDKLPMRGPAPK